MVASDLSPLCQAVFEVLPCEIVVHDGKIIVAANLAACRLLAAPTPRSLVGLPLASLVHADSTGIETQPRGASSGQRQSPEIMDVRLQAFDDRETRIRVLSQRFDVGNAPYALLVGIGATSHCGPPAKRHEDAPAFSAATPLAVAVLDAMPHPVTVFAADDAIVFANRAAAEALHADNRDELIGMPTSRVVHPLVAQAAEERRRLVLETGQSFADVAGKLMTLSGTPARTLSSLGRAKLPDGGHVGYWMARSVEALEADSAMAV